MSLPESARGVMVRFVQRKSFFNWDLHDLFEIRMRFTLRAKIYWASILEVT